MFLTHIESFPEAFEVKNSLKTDNFAFFSTHRAKSSFCFKITSYYDDSFDILQLVRRMFKIFLLTSRATLRQPFRYPQYILWSHRKFFRGIWSDWSPVLHQKNSFLAHTSISKKHLQFRIFSKVFHVSCNIFWLVRFELLYVSLPLRSNIIQHFRYPQNVFWMCIKFLEDSETTFLFNENETFYKHFDVKKDLCFGNFLFVFSRFHQYLAIVASYDHHSFFRVCS